MIILVNVWLRQKCHASQVRPDWDLNPWLPDHDSTFWIPEMPVLTTQPSGIVLSIRVVHRFHCCINCFWRSKPIVTHSILCILLMLYSNTLLLVWGTMFFLVTYLPKYTCCGNWVNVYCPKLTGPSQGSIICLSWQAALRAEQSTQSLAWLVSLCCGKNTSAD